MKKSKFSYYTHFLHQYVTPRTNTRSKKNTSWSHRNKQKYNVKKKKRKKNKYD